MLQLEILEHYIHLIPEMEKAVPFIENSLNELLKNKGIKLHGLTHRIKSIHSLKQKISRPDKIYHELSDVTDLIGFRVVTYFEDTIEQIAKLIEQKFTVDFANSTNKMQASHHERFGYRSLHYVCHLPFQSDLLPNKIRFEIQIRTVLQDAWAEVEHDLGYKANDIAPSHLRRRFSRIASLLEIADEEFVSIRNDLALYVEQMKKGSLPEKQDLPLDRVSLSHLVELSIVRTLDQAVAKQIGRDSVSETIFYPDYLIHLLHLSGLSTVALVQKAIEEHQTKTLALILPYFEFSKEAWELGM